MNRPGRTTVAALGAALLVGAGGGAGTYALVDGSGGAASPTAVVTTAQPAAAKASTLTINQIYKQDGPGVVDVVVSSSSSGGGGGFPPFGQRQAQAEGSGFVYDTKGDIVTNDHVVDGATSIRVKFASGKSYTATVVGADPSTDLAVIKVNAPASELKPLALADSSSVQVGDGVVAIGSPFGLTQSVTAGIVSALGRSIKAPNNYQIAGAIQTDAPINHGNSGGPLINLQGQVVGVNAQIESDSGDNAGVGFAIASNTVASVVPQLIRSGSVKHAFLGVTIGNAASGSGVAVSQVQTGSPADGAGLQAGDVITAVDGKSVDTTTELGSAIDAHKPGDKVSVTFTRGGASKTVTVTLGTRPSS